MSGKEKLCVDRALMCAKETFCVDIASLHREKRFVFLFVVHHICSLSYVRTHVCWVSSDVIWLWQDETILQNSNPANNIWLQHCFHNVGGKL